MVICTSSAIIYSSPDYMSEQIDEMLYGEEAEILDEKDGFYKIISEYGYSGWTSKENIFGKTKESNYVVTSPFSDLLLEGKYRIAPFMHLPRGAKLHVEFSRNSPRFGFVTHPNEYTFYIHKNHISKIGYEYHTQSEKRFYLCQTAKEYLGTQYCWGGRTHHGIDCSGLCFNAYRFNGINIWRDADISKSPNLRKISYEDARMGDLLFFKNHMAMYLGNGKIIHSSAENGCVAIENYNENKKLQDIFICAGTAF